MNTEISEQAIKTAHSALLSELNCRHQESDELRRMAVEYPSDEVWGRFANANAAIIGHLESAIQEFSIALFGETWGNLEEVGQ